MKTPDELRLLEYLDGRLSDAERAEVEAHLARDEGARRLVDEHRALWDLLGREADADVSTSEAFRRATVERARVDVAGAASWRRPGVWKRGVALAAAAALVVSVTVTWLAEPGEGYVVSDAERPIIGHLELLEHLDFLEEHGELLDVVDAWHRTRAFDDEVAMGDER